MLVSDVFHMLTAAFALQILTSAYKKYHFNIINFSAISFFRALCEPSLSKIKHILLTLIPALRKQISPTGKSHIHHHTPRFAETSAGTTCRTILAWPDLSYSGAYKLLSLIYNHLCEVVWSHTFQISEITPLD